MKKMLLVVGFAVVLLVALPLQAQSGCVNSPEAPTAVLALAGSVGALSVVVRGRRRGRGVKKRFA